MSSWECQRACETASLPTHLFRPPSGIDVKRTQQSARFFRLRADGPVHHGRDAGRIHTVSSQLVQYDNPHLHRNGRHRVR